MTDENGRIDSESNSNKNFNVQDENSTTNESSTEPSTTIWRDSYPVDWCLKTRVRFMSDSPFTWCGTLKTNEEASGLSWFTRGTVHEEVSTEQQVCNYNILWKLLYIKSDTRLWQNWASNVSTIKWLYDWLIVSCVMLIYQSIIL